MRSLAFLFLFLTLSLNAFAQGNQNNFDKTDKDKTSTKVVLGEEQEEFDTAATLADPADRISSLQKFIKNFPETEKKVRVLGLISSGRAELADQKLTNNETEAAIKLFKLAVQEAPTPFENKFYTSVILQIPSNLYFRGQQKAALEVIKLIEEKVANNPDQILAIASFYLGTENASGAIRLATRAIEIDPTSKGAYQTLGLAHRFNFDLEKSTEAYIKAVENNEGSTVAKLSLAEMKRATAKPSEAIAIYQLILKTDPLNIKARTGLILSLFDLGKVSEAETEMEKSLTTKPDNLFLLVGAAYWYAANGDGKKAVELSQKALGVEPRYSWAYIALAKGLMKTGDPLGAERSLLTARQFGNFPTLEYEIASARLAAGFYKDAAEDLRANFTIEDGVIKTKLGRRIEKEARSFTELLSLERRSSIFQPASGDNANFAEQLKKLLAFAETLDAKKEVKEEVLIKSADEFINGDDKMKLHRQLFVANQLLEKKKALPKVLELTKDAVKGIDDALEVESASSAVLADELYETRRIAILRGEALLVPEIPKQILTSILRGKIEEISGWALFKQEKNDEALIRLKRAASVMPKDSVWMRSTMWRTGKILDNQGESEKALDYYIKGFSIDDRSEEKVVTIETLYKKLNGSLDGLKERLEAKPVDASNTSSIFTKEGVVNTNVTLTKPNETPDEQPTEKNKNVEVQPKKDDIPDIVPIAIEDDKKDTVLVPEKSDTEEPLVKTEMIKSDELEEDKSDREASLPNDIAFETLIKIVPNSKKDSNETTSKVEVKKEEADDNKTVKPLKPVELNETQKAIDEEYDRLIAEMNKEASEDKSEETIIDGSDKSQEVKTDESDKSQEVKTDESDKSQEVKISELENQDEVKVADNTETNSGDSNLDIQLKSVKLKDETKKDSDKTQTDSTPKTFGKNILVINDSLSNSNEVKKVDDTREAKLDARLKKDVNIKNEGDDLAEIDKNADAKTNDEVKDVASKTDLDEIVDTVVIDDTDKKADEKTNDENLSNTEPTKDTNDSDSATRVKKTDDVSEELLVKIPKVLNETIESIDEKNDSKDLDKSESVEEKKEDKTTTTDLGATRPRLVVEEVEEDVECTVFLSQDVVSIFNGDSLGVLVGDTKETEISEIKATSSSPSDVEVTLNPEIGVAEKRAYFRIRSISTNQGVFNVKFITPCGEKEILVKVR